MLQRLFNKKARLFCPRKAFKPNFEWNFEVSKLYKLCISFTDDGVPCVADIPSFICPQHEPQYHHHVESHQFHCLQQILSSLFTW